MRSVAALIVIISGMLDAVAALASDLRTSVGSIKVEQIVGGLDQPWAIGFLPDNSVLITERDGRVLLRQGEDLTQLGGVPIVVDDGQGGLLDVLVPRDFAETQELFFSYAKPQRSGSGTAIFRATFAEGARSLTDVRTIFELTEGSSGGRHFGSRIVEAPDGHLFLTIGDRGDRPSAQDLSRENGSVVRISRDGSIPPDNPFVGDVSVRPAIWSYGHRNPQGAALDLRGNLVTVEHGARGGDEINRIRPGANYGWPLIAYGRHYSGQPIGVGTSAPGLEQPDYYWDPSMAPSGMMIYSGKLWPDWRGDIFVGSLKFDYIARLEGEPMAEVEQLTSDETGRVRDVREAPDGTIWFLSVGNGALYRMSPG